MLRAAAFAVLLVAVTAGVIPADRSAEHRRHRDNQHPDEEFVVTRQASRLAETENEFWLKQGLDFVERQRNEQKIKKVAKNVIIFLGDGMSATTIAATRPYVQSEDYSLHFEGYSGRGAAKTYAVNYQVPDSASTANAYLCGVKTNYGTIGVTAAVNRYNCTAQQNPDNQLRSIAGWAQDAGKWTGLVTTSEVTDASPAALYAHAANRYWENDVELRRHCDDPNVQDIARQLISGDVGSKFRVIMGGGRQEFRNSTVRDEEGKSGRRSDSRDLIGEWLQKHNGQRAQYVWSADDLRAIQANDTDYLLGLFEASDLKYRLEISEQKLERTEPTLAELTVKAIEVLRRNEQGFFLFVENGLIDSAHHGTYARLALDETSELDKAVRAAREMLPLDDTLIVVTSDHSHTMTYAGYQYRKQDIAGKVFNSSDDKMPFMALSYANGRGFANQLSAAGRVNLTDVDTSGLRWRFPATVPLNSESHAGDDVLVYASGPWSHLFNGAYEQNAIPYLMSYAACMNGLCQDDK